MLGGGGMEYFHSIPRRSSLAGRNQTSNRKNAVMRIFISSVMNEQQVDDDVKIKICRRLS